MNEVRKKYEYYKQKTNIFIPFDTFINAKELIAFHEQNIGTVVKKHDKNLKCYEHLYVFGVMLFFLHLTEQQINDGPIIYECPGDQICVM